VAGYIKERTKNAQFIVISLRNNMFELAERLVGIYKVSHMTKSVTVENKDYLAMQRQQRLQEAREHQRRELCLQSAVQQSQQSQQTQQLRPGTAGSAGSGASGASQALPSAPVASSSMPTPAKSLAREAQ
jgi:hypothetical protein